MSTFGQGTVLNWYTGIRPSLARNLDGVRSALRFDIAPERIQSVIDRQQQSTSARSRSDLSRGGETVRPSSASSSYRDHDMRQGDVQSFQQPVAVLATASDGMRRYGGSAVVVQQGGAGTDASGQNDIKRQLEELNRQRLEAQKKLDELINKQCTEAVQVLSVNFNMIIDDSDLHFQGRIFNTIQFFLYK